MRLSSWTKSLSAVVALSWHPWLPPVGAKYASLGGAGSYLGVAIAAMRCGLVRGGCYQNFQGGKIYYLPANGSQVV